MPTKNENETDTLGQDEPNSAPATQCTSNQSPSPANHCIANQLPAAANLDDQRENKKEKGQCSIRREQQKPEKEQCQKRNVF